MIFTFTGDRPQRRTMNIGAMGNNKTNCISFRLKRIQGCIDLYEYTPYIKFHATISDSESETDYFDIDEITEISIIEEEDKDDILELKYKFKSETTSHRSVDCQLEFEKDVLIWQTQMFTLRFFPSIEFEREV